MPWIVCGYCIKRWSIYSEGWECVEVGIKRLDPDQEPQVEERWEQTPAAAAVYAAFKKRKLAQQPEPETKEPENKPKPEEPKLTPGMPDF
jgi:hypothetical protein